MIEFYITEINQFPLSHSYLRLDARMVLLIYINGWEITYFRVKARNLAQQNLRAMKYQPIDRPSSRLKWRMNSMFAFQENIVAASLEYIDFSNISLPRSEQPAKLFMEIRKYFSIKQTLRSPIRYCS